MDTVQNTVGPKAPRALFHSIYLLHRHINHRGPCLPVPSWRQQWTVKWKIRRGLWTRCIKIWRDICLAQHQPLQTHRFMVCLWKKWGECGSVEIQDAVSECRPRWKDTSYLNHINLWQQQCRGSVMQTWSSISSCALQQGANTDLLTRLCNLHISWYQLCEVIIWHL